MNRSKATALVATLVLHVVAIAWLLMLRFDLAPSAVVESRIAWLPDFLEPLPPPPPPLEAPPASSISIAAESLPFPIPIIDLSEVEPESLPDWYAGAREVAGAIGKEPGYYKFGETPKAPPGRPKEEYPPSIYDDEPLARVGTAYRTPEGEQILWVSDHCWISLGSQSLTMADFHKARNGIRRCNIALGRREPRGDLFDHLKRKKPDPLKKPE